MNNNYSDDIIAKEVRRFWRKSYPQEVIVYFWQKYKFENSWDWREELVECASPVDYESVIFYDDFCEGQTCVKDITIVPLDTVIGFYAEQHKLQTKEKQNET